MTKTFLSAVQHKGDLNAHRNINLGDGTGSGWVNIAANTGMTFLGNGTNNGGFDGARWIATAPLGDIWAGSGGIESTGLITANAGMEAWGDVTVGAHLYCATVPAADNDVANKLYVDQQVAGAGGGMDEAAADTRYVNITGDTMVGTFSVTEDDSGTPRTVLLADAGYLQISDSNLSYDFTTAIKGAVYVQKIGGRTGGGYIEAERYVYAAEYVRAGTYMRIGTSTPGTSPPTAVNDVPRKDYVDSRIVAVPTASWPPASPQTGVLYLKVA